MTSPLVKSISGQSIKTWSVIVSIQFHDETEMKDERPALSLSGMSCRRKRKNHPRRRHTNTRPHVACRHSHAPAGNHGNSTRPVVPFLLSGMDKPPDGCLNSCQSTGRSILRRGSTSCCVSSILLAMSPHFFQPQPSTRCGLHFYPNHGAHMRSDVVATTPSRDQILHSSGVCCAAQSNGAASTCRIRKS